MRDPRRSERGFTLIEVMIALTLMSFIMMAVFISQGNSLSSSGRARNIIIATSLAKNFIAERELMYENRAFDKLEPKSAGTFPAPNDQYRWSLEVSEVNFGPLTNLLLAQTAKSEDPNAGQATQLLKMFEKYLKDSVRRMKVTIEYPDGGKHSSLTFTELLVNYDAEFTGGI